MWDTLANAVELYSTPDTLTPCITHIREKYLAHEYDIIILGVGTTAFAGARIAAAAGKRVLIERFSHETRRGMAALEQKRTRY